MSTKLMSERLAVCSWSLRPENPQDLFAQLEAIGLRRVQLALDPLRESPQVWGNIGALCRQHGVVLVSGMFTCVGEDYSTLETIRATGGIVPDANWEQNWRNIQATAPLAQKLGLKLVTFHAGFLPHEEAHAAQEKLQQRLGQIADLFAMRGIVVALETGQETPATLRQLLQKLKRSNIGVNFDPANMILYDMGDPIEALRKFGPWIRQVHLKDARRTKAPGAWGEEVVVGTGEVDWPAFFSTLRALNFTGDLCLEREASAQRSTDLRAGREYIESLFA